MESILMNVDDVARALGMSRSLVYQMVSRRELPVVRIGRSVRIPAAALEAWVHQRTALTTETEQIHR